MRTATVLALGFAIVLSFARVTAAQTDSPSGSTGTLPTDGQPTRLSAELLGTSAAVSDAGTASVPPGRALLMSFLVPGWGQHALGHKRSSALLLVSEAFLWLGAATYATLSDWKENDYKLYAATHAAVHSEGKDKQFFVNIGNYSSLDDYNQAKLRGRNLRDYYRDREAYYWRWDSPEDRIFYENLRVTSDRYANRAELMLGGVLANHLVSGLHALWLARRQQHWTSRRSWDWHAQVFPYPAVQVTARF